MTPLGLHDPRPEMRACETCGGALHPTHKRAPCPQMPLKRPHSQPCGAPCPAGSCVVAPLCHPRLHLDLDRLHDGLDLALGACGLADRREAGRLEA
eukprot:3620477-Prymnesium_polylepis.1